MDELTVYNAEALLASAATPANPNYAHNVGASPPAPGLMRKAPGGVTGSLNILRCGTLKGKR